MNRNISKLLQKYAGLFIAMAVTALWISFSVSRPAVLELIESKLYDTRMNLRSHIEPSGKVVVAAVDEKSVKEIGKWVWPRTVMAALVEKLTLMGARAIGFDIVFSEPDQHSQLTTINHIEERMKQKNITGKSFVGILDELKAETDSDTTFAAMLKAANNTTLGYFFLFDDEEVQEYSEEDRKRGLMSIIWSQYNFVKFLNEDAAKIEFPAAPVVVSNIKELAGAATGQGYFNFGNDDDGTVRRANLITKYNKYYFPPLSLQMLKTYLKEDVEVEVDSDGINSIKIGSRDIPVSRGGEMLINFYGPEKIIPHISVADILFDRVDAETIKNKIVLVGATATGIYDMRVTPVQKDYPGPEINATIIDNILTSRFLAEPENAQEIEFWMLLLIGVLVGLVLPRLSPGRSFAAALFVMGGLFYGNAKMFELGQVFNLAYPLTEIFTIFITVTLYRYFTEEKEKRFYRGAFSRYLSPAVIAQIVDDPSKLKLGGERRRITAFFSDVAKFSTISEKLTPEQLVELLNIYLSAMTDIILKYAGTVDKYEGDAIICFYGAPVPQEDHALRCCKASLEMIHKLAAMREEWKKTNSPQLTMRIGMNTGDAVVGNMGSTFRFDYTMMGDTVNLASRLEGANKNYGSEVMMSEFTYADVKDHVVARELDVIRVVGKAQPIKVYELIALKGSETSEQAQVVAAYESALELYKLRDWPAAAAKFDAAARLASEQAGKDDPPSKVYAERCRRFMENPPPADWDGVYQLTEK